jgi:hypothetical protein
MTLKLVSDWKEGNLHCALNFNYLVIPALCWNVSRRMVVLPYRRFGTTYRSMCTPEEETNGLSRNVGKELPPCAA